MVKKTKLEELINKYELYNQDANKFHKDLALYYDMSKNPMLSEWTEREWLSNHQLQICKEYNINYPTFLRNLYMLDRYMESFRVRKRE